MAIMRTPLPLEIPHHLVELATLYAPSRDPLQAVSYVLQDYPNLVADIRKMRIRLDDFHEEGQLLDEKLAALQDLCRQILDL
ncbi:TPA: hypothetical protein QDZ42_004015 [Stenotrophomonas maltophilia]|nr:hypothetical protein [Stenotrophomonas maltophilia]